MAYQQLAERVSAAHTRAMTDILVLCGCGNRRYNLQTQICIFAGSAPAVPPAKEVQPPEDMDLKRTIDAMAPFVARNGAAFEAIAVRQNARDNRFSFLKGGPGAEYYRWRVQASTCSNSQNC